MNQVLLGSYGRPVILLIGDDGPWENQILMRKIILIQLQKLLYTLMTILLNIDSSYFILHGSLLTDCPALYQRLYWATSRKQIQVRLKIDLSPDSIQPCITVKGKKLYAAWSKQGNVLVRKTESNKIIQVFDNTDLMLVKTDDPNGLVKEWYH